jgi:hypothetical protein
MRLDPLQLLLRWEYKKLGNHLMRHIDVVNDQSHHDHYFLGAG